MSTLGREMTRSRSACRRWLRAMAWVSVRHPADRSPPTTTRESVWWVWLSGSLPDLSFRLGGRPTRTWGAASQLIVATTGVMAVFCVHVFRRRGPFVLDAWPKLARVENAVAPCSEQHTRSRLRMPSNLMFFPIFVSSFFYLILDSIPFFPPFFL